MENRPAAKCLFCGEYLMVNKCLVEPTESNNVMSQKSCFSLGPPVYSWDGWILGGGLSNIPDEEASSL